MLCNHQQQSLINIEKKVINIAAMETKIKLNLYGFTYLISLANNLKLNFFLSIL